MLSALATLTLNIIFTTVYVYNDGYYWLDTTWEDCYYLRLNITKQLTTLVSNQATNMTMSTINVFYIAPTSLFST